MDIASRAERGVGSLPPLAGAVSGLQRTGRKRVATPVAFLLDMRVRAYLREQSAWLDS